MIRRGFTLIEVLVVIAIIAVVALFYPWCKALARPLVGRLAARICIRSVWRSTAITRSGRDAFSCTTPSMPTLPHNSRMPNRLPRFTGKTS